MGNAVEILSTSRGMVIVNDGINLGRAELREDRVPVKEPEHHCAVLTFQRNESSETEYQRVRVHRERKRSLGHRLVVLRNYIKRCYGDDWVNDSSHWNELEDWLDCALKENDYDLERAIDYYRSIAPELKIIDGRCKCGYMPPFCACNS